MIKTLFATAALAALATAAPAAMPDADPAMWVVKDADTIVYLFGTFHGLDGKSDWFNDEVKTAFDASQEVYLEAILPENMAELQPLLVKYAVDPTGKTLTSRLSPEAKAKYEKAMGKIGIPSQAFEPLEPWAVSMTMVGIAGQKLGLKPEHGADAVITKAAKGAGKKLGELEGAEAQFRMFDAMPEAQQVKQLEITLDEVEKMGPQLQAMLASWGQGDAPGLAKLITAGFEQDPELYELMLTKRNAAWADWIAKRMDQPGTVFVAVGAGHLVGKDSVQDVLAAKGLKSERVKN